MTNKMQLFGLFICTNQHYVFRATFRPSSGALDCIYSFYYSPPRLMQLSR